MEKECGRFDCRCVYGVGLAGCSDAEPVTRLEETAQLQIGVSEIRTRALDNAFEVRDSIGLYAVIWQDETTPGRLHGWGNYAENVAFVLQDEADNWLVEEPVYYPADGRKLDLYAYYPYHREWTYQDTTRVYFRVVADQTDYADYTASDFVTAKTPGVVRTSQKVHLTFDHKLSQLVFHLKAGEGFSVADLQNAQITVKNAILDVTYDLAEGNDGIPVTGEERADVLPTGEWQTSSADDSLLYDYKAIIAPQELNETIYLEVKIGNRVFTQRFSTPVDMKSGESCLFTITVNNTELAVSTTLNPWNYQGEVEGEANEEEVDPDAFIVEWEVGTGESVLMSFLNTGNLVVNWGDGSEPQHIGSGTSVSYQYAEPGTYEVHIKGTCQGFTMGEIREVKQWGNLGVTFWNSAFSGCTTLESIPAAPLPGGYDLQYMFKGCSRLKEIPSDLFHNVTVDTDFSRTFQGCSSLTSIPSGLFDNVSARNFIETFKDCESLVSIPEGLFKNCTGGEFYDDIFNGCKSLTKLPESLFPENNSIRNLQGTFMNCESLEEIPSGIFANCTSIYTFTKTFEGCKSLKEIPGNLFANNPLTYAFVWIFSGCESLEQIPAGLFANNPETSGFPYTFKGCTGLSSIPETLFDHCPKIYDFSYAFKDCSNLQGHTPTTHGIELWERSSASYPQYPDVINLAGCFEGCYQLANYNEIPDNAK